MDFATQDEVDAAFADLDGLLAEREAPSMRLHCCQHCGSTRLERCTNEGANVPYYSSCESCGVVQESGFGFGDTDYYRAVRPVSNYRRIHHWHERISQLCLLESQIPDDQFLQIAEKLCDGTYQYINKDVIRTVLRSLDMQLYIEKWLSIVHRVTGVSPPRPGPTLLIQLDRLFQDLQRPFVQYRTEGRKNFLNYNFVFTRLFQHLNCPQFGMFFPLIKSKQKMRQLDETWTQMVSSIGWEVKPLQAFAPFAVRLEQPAEILYRLRSQVAAASPAVTHTVPWKTGFRKSDLRLLRELDRQREQAQRRSNPPEPVSQRPAASSKRSRPASGALPRLKRPAPRRAALG